MTCGWVTFSRASAGCGSVAITRYVAESLTERLAQVEPDLKRPQVDAFQFDRHPVVTLRAGDSAVVVQFFELLAQSTRSPGRCRRPHA